MLAYQGCWRCKLACGQLRQECRGRSGSSGTCGSAAIASRMAFGSPLAVSSATSAAAARFMSSSPPPPPEPAIAGPAAAAAASPLPEPDAAPFTAAAVSAGAAPLAVASGLGHRSSKQLDADDAW